MPTRIAAWPHSAGVAALRRPIRSDSVPMNRRTDTAATTYATKNGVTSATPA